MKRTKQTLFDDEERFSISRFLGFHVNTISSPSEDTHLDGSHPPPMEEQEKSVLAKRTPPPPPPSNGDSGQTN
ncbi:hypothetical protein SDJN03_30363, partial [Cucurbita argyrosperma subsp. sororia]